VISGDLWALPTPDPLFVRTELDLDTGQCELKDRPNG
jgi:predicted component of type VI protein secretion system